ncbi:MAG TPA: hypothetical protein VH280_11785 [Verrucomicrobiae bacterium]|jgi:hypothetical protein|nr:hypothetical protein [Verrucomicrobiae bacterium]
MKTIAAVLVLAVIVAASARGQGFLNLDFESAYGLPGSPVKYGELVSVTNALPGWTANVDKNALSDINYVSNMIYGVSTLVELEGGSLTLSGDFSVRLDSGGSISQTGLVPDNAESLQFEAIANAQPNLYVILGGQSLSYSVLFAGSGYDVYGANIPAEMDGLMETLTFGIEGPSYSVLDNIEFSPQIIPEPSEFGLIGVGAVVFEVLRRRKDVWPRKNARAARVSVVSGVILERNSIAASAE